MKAWLKGGLIGIGIFLIFLLATFISGFLGASNLIILFSVAIIFLVGGFIIGIFISFIIGKIGVKKKNQWIVVVFAVVIIARALYFSYISIFLKKEVNLNLCSENQRNADCPAVYEPVCGCADTGIRCIQAPCSAFNCKTYSNYCDACVNDKVTYWTDGECLEEK